MLLKLDQVSKSFGGLAAVQAMNLTVAEGEIVGLIGPNGAGKTTLFNLMTGFYHPEAGLILFREQNVTSLKPPERCKLGIARTFQLVRPFQHLTLLENVAVGRVYGREPARDRQQAEQDARELLNLVGLKEQPDVAAYTLTLMNRKRLELARALATRPYLLLLDELLAGLNPSEVLVAMDLIRQIRDMGTTIIMVEHLIKALFGVSDRVVVMDAGEKIAEGAPADVARDPNVVAAYLGTERHAYA